MQFTQIPILYTALGQEVLYVVEQESPGNIDIRIRTPTTSQLLGAKRFPETSRAEFDIAPRLRHIPKFTPTTDGTGFKSDSGRTLSVQLEALVSSSGSIATRTPVRHLIPGDTPAVGSRIRTSMPTERLIPDGACDELTLLTNKACAITVTGTAGNTATAESFQNAATGLILFRLDTRDFPGCETITVDAGACGSIRYTVIPARQEAVRLAWRSRAGSLEHYSFPVVRNTSLLITKQRTEGPGGEPASAAEVAREMQLVSAYERQEVLEALAEAASSPEVWLAEGDGYIPAEVLTEEVVIQRHGTLCNLELTVRPKNERSWS